MDPFTLLSLGLGVIGGLMNRDAQKDALQAQKDAAAEEMKQAREQFEAQQKELERQQGKEQYTQDSNAGALDSVFGEKKKKKDQGDVFLSDMQGLF